MAKSIIFDKPLPLNGEGTISVNDKRSQPFAIRIQPDYPSDCPESKKGYVEVRIDSNEACFWGRKPDAEEESLGKGNSEGALEPERKVSYWFSFNRNGRFLKYGKGYIMEETTHLEQGAFGPPKEKPEDDEWWFIFRPDTPKQVMILTLGPVLYASKSLVDMEKLVGFYPYPLTKNWSPVVIDSSNSTLDNLARNDFTQSASLPETCRELYENVAAAGVALDAPNKYPKLSDAIKYSINTEGKILYKKLKEKREKGDMEYLRVTVGQDRGASPGVPYVLEIWPKGSESPIHNHGNAYAVIKVLYGVINISIYNKTWKDASTQEKLNSFVASKGDVTWLSPNWYQTHKLSNQSSEFCATIQCYKYGPEDYLNWPYFDYLDGKEEGVHEFYPDSDFEFLKMRDDLLLEYRENMERDDQQKVNP